MINRTISVAVCAVFMVLAVGTITANADTRHSDLTSSGGVKLPAGVMLALNPQPLPPKCPPPGCNNHRNQQKRHTNH